MMFLPASARLSRLKSQGRAFLRTEDGSFVIFALFLLIAMLMVSGVAVDTMRAENARVNLQNTADRAALAAANLENDLDAEQTVISYFDRANMLQYLDSVDVRETGDTRTVIVNTSATVRSTFLRLVGMDSLPSIAGAVAGQTAGNLEISVVVDVSSSMNQNSRLTNLQSALTEFIAEVVPEGINPGEASNVTVSLVPYSMTVNLGSTLGPFYPLSAKHAYSECAYVPHSDYASLAIDTTVEMERYSHFQDGSGGYEDDGTLRLPYCPTDDTNAVVAHATSRAELLPSVAGLQPWDGTSIDLGVKWALHLLDPSFNPIMQQMRTAGLRHMSLAGRPVIHEDTGTTKVLVVMTDGENDEMRDLYEGFRAGPSDVWYDPVTDKYSVLLEDGRETGGTSWWYHVHNDTIRDYPSMPGHGSTTDWTDVLANLDHLTWPEVFDLAKSTDFAEEFFETPRNHGYIDDALWDMVQDPIIHRVSQTDTVQRLSDICALARAAGVIIYGIAFEPPSSDAQDAIRDCASSEAHFFSAEGLEITSAFSAIGRDMQQLRLMQ